MNIRSVGNSSIFFLLLCFLYLPFVLGVLCLPPHLPPISHLSLPHSVARRLTDADRIPRAPCPLTSCRVGSLKGGNTFRVFQGCHKKAPQTEWLEQQEFNFSQFWRVQVPDQWASSLVPCEVTLLGLQMTTFFPCPHGVFPLCESAS